MNRDKAITIIGNRLSFRDESDMSAFILNEMDLAQEDKLEAEAFLPWFLRVEFSEAIAEDATDFPLPEGFLRFSEYDSVFVLKDDELIQELIIHDSADAQRHFADTADRDIPQILAAVGEASYRFWPAADGDYTITGAAFCRAALPSSIAGSGENLWLKHSPRLLIGETGMACAAILRDGDAYKIFTEMAMDARRLLEQRDSERRLSGQTLTF